MPVAAFEIASSPVGVMAVVVPFFVVISGYSHEGFATPFIVNSAVLVVSCAMGTDEGGLCVHALLCTMSCTLRASAAPGQISW